MRKLIAICGLLLSVSVAHAQTEKAATVTKLPGEESLSLRERAERDFLMPVRRKKIVVEAPKVAADDVTASPETDVTAHYSAAADEVRSEEVAAPVHETHVATRSRATRHAAWLAARHSKATKSSKASKSSNAKASSRKSKAKTAHSKVKTKTKAAAKSSKSKVSKKSTATKKSSTHKAAKKVTTHKASASKKRRR